MQLEIVRSVDNPFRETDPSCNPVVASFGRGSGILPGSVGVDLAALGGDPLGIWACILGVVSKSHGTFGGA